MAVKIIIRHDSAANWASVNPTLSLGELGFDTDSKKYKLGDGSTAWSSLEFAGMTAAEISSAISAAISNLIDSAPGTLDTLNELAAALGDNPQLFQDVIDLGTDLNNLGTTVNNINSELGDHEGAITNIHGISDTRDLVYETHMVDAINTHRDDTTNVHGIADTSLVALTQSPTFTGTVSLPVNTTIDIQGGGSIGVDAFALLSDITATATELNVLDGILASTSELNTLDGITASVNELNVLDGITTSTAELNTLDGITTSTTELNYVSGVTSNIQTQLDAKALSSTVSSHTSATTNVHGIADTSALETKTGAQNKADTAEAAANTYTDNTVGALTTGDIPEGSNLYYTDERAQDAVGNNLGSGLTYNDAAGVIELDAAVTIGNTTTDGSFSVVKSSGISTLSVNSEYDVVGIKNNLTVEATTSAALVQIYANDSMLSFVNSGQYSTGNINSKDGSTDLNIDVNNNLNLNALSGNIILNADGTSYITSANAGNEIATQGYVGGVETTLQGNIDLKAPIANPTFTGTVSGITKSMVGLGNVDNTTDANKPVSTATQTALDLKANLAGPTFTGTAHVNDLVIDGALTFSGTAQEITTTNLSVTDSLIYLADEQFDADAVDIGIYGAYGDSNAGHWHTGLIRDASDGKWKLISGGDEPTSNIVDFTGVTYDTLKIGALEATSATIGNVSNTELQYLDGVTSAIQTQLDAKLASATAASTYAPLASPTFTGTVTLPTGTVTSEMIVDGTIVNGDISSSAAIAVSKLAASTISGKTLGSNLDSLTIGTGLSGTSYNGSGAVTIAIDSTVATKTGTETLTNKTITLASGGVTFSDGTVQVSAGVPSLTTITHKTASYTLASLAERDTIIEIDSTSATTLTIPLDSATNYPVGTTLDIIQTNTGQVTIAGDTGVTVNATPGLKLRTRWSSATLLKRAADTWLVFGDLSA